MIATVSLFVLAFGYQLLVTPARLHREVEDERDAVRRDLDVRDEFVRTVVETEETTEQLIKLHAEGKRLYFDATDLDGWNYRLNEWEKQVEALIENRLSLGELHYFRNMKGSYGFRRVHDASEEWNEKMERRLFHFTGVLDRLNDIIPHMRHVHMKAIFDYGKRQRADGEL